MSRTLTFNGTLGETTESFARRVSKTLGVATSDSGEKFAKAYTIRKDALDGSQNTPLPISIVPGMLNYSFLMIRVQGSALFTIIAGGGTHTITVGSQAQPEGIYFVFGDIQLVSVSLTNVSADNTLVEVIAAGDVGSKLLIGLAHALSEAVSSIHATAPLIGQVTVLSSIAFSNFVARTDLHGSSDIISQVGTTLFSTALLNLVWVITTSTVPDAVLTATP